MKGGGKGKLAKPRDFQRIPFVVFGEPLAKGCFWGSVCGVGFCGMGVVARWDIVIAVGRDHGGRRNGSFGCCWSGCGHVIGCTDSAGDVGVNGCIGIAVGGGGGVVDIVCVHVSAFVIRSGRVGSSGGGGVEGAVIVGAGVVSGVVVG